MPKCWQPAILSREVTKLGLRYVTACSMLWLSRLLACRFLGQSAIRSPAAPQLPAKTQIPLTYEHLAIVGLLYPAKPSQPQSTPGPSSSDPCHTHPVAIVVSTSPLSAILSTTIHYPYRPHPLRHTSQWHLLPPRPVSRCSSVC